MISIVGSLDVTGHGPHGSLQEGVNTCCFRDLSVKILESKVVMMSYCADVRSVLTLIKIEMCPTEECFQLQEIVMNQNRDVSDYEHFWNKNGKQTNSTMFLNILMLKYSGRKFRKHTLNMKDVDFQLSSFQRRQASQSFREHD